MTRGELIQSVLLNALELPEGEREAFVRAAALDEAMAAEVLSLLRFERVAGGALDPFTTGRLRTERDAAEDLLLAGDAATDDENPAGRRVGRFTIIRELGRGGMGVVYEATQDRPRRRVALKLLAGLGAMPSVRRRLEFEAEVLGRLRHPGIAQVYEAGVAEVDGRARPYFAMELVEGLAIDDFAAKRGLSTRDRLGLLAGVADAVEHAHQRGVIHRDLKPANILVTEDGQPKVLDFGVARVTDSDLRTTTFETRAGSLIGTLAYMSPEQASGDPGELDTRSDVYALGVIAYELLAGTLPYTIDGSRIHEAITAIRDTDPASLSSSDRTLRGDVETIVGKALEKDKSRRYQSAAELAADIRRYLAHQPITAAPPSATYQLRKFARRHKGLVGGAVATVAVLVAGLAASTMFAIRAEQARALTADALAERDDALLAEQERNADLRATSMYYQRLVERIDPAVAGASASGYLQEFVRARALGASTAEQRAYAEELLAGLSEPGVEIDLGRALVQDVLLDPARASAGRLAVERPGTQAGIMLALANSYRDIDRFDDAAELYRNAYEISKSTEPENTRLLSMLSADRNYALVIAGRVDEAAGEIAAYDSRDAVLALEEPERSDVAFQVGMLVYERRQNEQAIWYLRRALEGFAGRLGPDNGRTQMARVALANALYKSGHHGEAERLYEEEIASVSRSKGPESRNMAVALANQSMMFLETGKMELAEETVRRALQIVISGTGENHWITGNIRAKLARVLASRHEFDEASRQLEIAYPLHVKDLGPGHHRTREIAEQAAALFDAWHGAEPGAGHDKAAAVWRSRIDPEG